MRQTKQLQLIRRKMSRGILGAFVLVISAATPTLCLAATNGSNPSAARSNTVSGSNTSYLISYSSDKVIPVAPAPLPSKANANVESVLPTVVVPFTAGVDIPNPPAPPKQVLAPVPASVASKLAAHITLSWIPTKRCTLWLRRDSRERWKLAQMDPRD